MWKERERREERGRDYLRNERDRENWSEKREKRKREKKGRER